MKKISELGKEIIDNRLPGTDEKLFNVSLKEFTDRIKTYEDWEDILKVIEYDKSRYLLPSDICDTIFNRLIELGTRTPYVLKWYALILRMYGDPSDYKKAEELEKEAGENNI